MSPIESAREHRRLEGPRITSQVVTELIGKPEALAAFRALGTLTAFRALGAFTTLTTIITEESSESSKQTETGAPADTAGDYRLALNYLRILLHRDARNALALLL